VVRSDLVEIAGVRLEGAVQRDFTHDHDMVEALAPDRFYEPLDMAILPRRARRGGGALRAALVPNTNKETLQLYILTKVQPGSVVNTDEASFYKTLEQIGSYRALVYNVMNFNSR
jgi:hypothetical protein